MKDYIVVLKYADAVLGRILTNPNHGLTIDEALDSLDIDMDKYAAEQGWDGWDYEQLSLELEEEKKDYTDYETGMASALLGAVLSRDEEKTQVRPRVIWEGEYAGFTFQTIIHGRKDAPKFTEVCIDKDGVERGWCALDEEGAANWACDGFPWYDGIDWEMPEGMTEKGLDDFFQTQPADEAFRRLYQDGRIFLVDIQEGLEERLKDAKDEDDRKQAVRDAKRAAFNLGALDIYAELSKQPQEEFWDKERENDGGYYTMWKLPDFCKADVDEFDDLYSAYNAGTYTGEEAAERYEREVLTRELADAQNDIAEAQSDDNDFLAEKSEEKCSMLKARMESDECGWGANWWND